MFEGEGEYRAPGQSSDGGIRAMKEDVYELLRLVEGGEERGNTSNEDLNAMPSGEYSPLENDEIGSRMSKDDIPAISAPLKGVLVTNDSVDNDDLMNIGMKDGQMRGQVDNVCNTQDVISMNEVEGGGSVEQPCEFKRGICKTHNIKGNKTVVKSKKWAAKKTGFGWVTSSKVTYTCNLARAMSSNPSTTEDSTQLKSSLSPASNSKKQGELFKLSLDNFPGRSNIESESFGSITSATCAKE